MSKKIIIVFIIVLLGLSAAVFSKKYQNKAGSNGKVLIKKDRGITEETTKIYYDRIKKAEADLSGLKTNDTDYKTRFINDNIYLAQQYFGLGELNTSKEYYFKVLALDPKYESAMVGLAVTYSDAGELEEAKQIINEAIQNNPKNYNLWLQLADLQTALKMGSGEIDQTYQDALKATNNYIDVVTRYAQFLEGTGKIDGAIGQWQLAIKLNPDRKDIYSQEISRLKNLQK